MNNILLISDAAKEVRVESHVLRYWEEELHLPIKRNELGHRYYTREDVERFKQIKGMKERGLQLKAIKMILKDGKLDVLVPEEEQEGRSEDVQGAEEEKIHIDIIQTQENGIVQETREEKARRLQWLLQQLIRETLQENNKELCREIKESIVKELDYQFRTQEEKDEEKNRLQTQRNEEYYQRMDDLLRRKSRSGRSRNEKALKKGERDQKEQEEKENTRTENLVEEVREKKKGRKRRRSIF
jgi:DNA-binding transcriptional MerR regulator